MHQKSTVGNAPLEETISMVANNTILVQLPRVHTDMIILCKPLLTFVKMSIYAVIKKERRVKSDKFISASLSADSP